MTIDLASKPALRRHALARRDMIEPAEAHRAAEAVARRGLKLIGNLAQPGAVVSAYWPIRSEISTRPLLEALARAGFRTALPVMGGAGKAMRFRLWTPGDELEKGPLGLSEPLEGAPEAEPAVMLVPLACFDAQAHRIGYGGGNFDATLAALRARGKIVAIGLAYANQEVGAIPADPHDQTLDYVLTEQETFTFGKPA